MRHISQHDVHNCSEGYIIRSRKLISSVVPINSRKTSRYCLGWDDEGNHREHEIDQITSSLKVIQYRFHTPVTQRTEEKREQMTYICHSMCRQIAERQRPKSRSILFHTAPVLTTTNKSQKFWRLVYSLKGGLVRPAETHPNGKNLQWKAVNAITAKSLTSKQTLFSMGVAQDQVALTVPLQRIWATCSAICRRFPIFSSGRTIP